MEAAQDTTIPPVEPGQEPVAQEPQAPAQEPAVQEPTPTPQAEPTMTLHQVQSWIGRRDAQLREEFQGQINQIIQAVQTRNAPQVEDTDPTTELLNNPIAFMEKFVEQKMTQKETAQTQKTQAFITSAARLMDADPDFADNKLGMEVIEQMKTIPMNHNLPPDVAADLVISKAKAQVLASRVNKKVNPLANNKPAAVPLGTVTPSAAPSPAKPSVKIDDEVRAYGRKLGMTDEEIDAEFK